MDNNKYPIEEFISSEYKTKAIKFRRDKNFDIYSTFDCGQCFRFEEENKIITGVAFGKVIKIKQIDDTVYIYNTTKDDFYNIWYSFLGLDEDYDLIKDDVINHFGKYGNTINDAINVAGGIHILRQDKWEALCSFIISQNNNIPRIKKIIDKICLEYGERIEAFGNVYYSFPSAEVISKISLEELRSFGTGFRDRYISDTANAVASGKLDLCEISKMESEDAIKTLMQMRGIGLKVASCAILFGFHKLDSFPIDVWIKRVIEKYYSNGIDLNNLGDYAGVAQQYLFYYERYIVTKN